MQIPILDQIVSFVSNLKNLAITLALALAVISIIYVGYRYIFTAKEANKTHSTLIYVIAGVLLVVLVYLLPQLIKEILGDLSKN